MSTGLGDLPRAMPLGALCAELALVGIRLDVGAGYQLVASPRSAVTSVLAQALREWKPLLYSFVRRYGSRAAPEPCACCRVELVAEAGEYCPWCNVIRGREVSIAPCSAEEVAYLKLLSVPGRTVPDRPHSDPGTVGDSGDTLPEVSHVRAHKETFWKRPETVPKAQTVPTAQIDFEVA